jgi:hypothetical protein
MLDKRELTAKLESLSNNARRHKRNKYTVLAIIVLMLMAPFIIYIVDTEIFPVTTGATALVFEETDQTVTALSILYTKKRNCRILSADFFSNGSAIRVIETLETGPLLNRPLGKNISRTFRLKIPRADFIDHGIIQFQHRCHALWTHRRIIFGE